MKRAAKAKDGELRDELTRYKAQVQALTAQLEEQQKQHMAWSKKHDTLRDEQLLQLVQAQKQVGEHIGATQRVCSMIRESLALLTGESDGTAANEEETEVTIADLTAAAAALVAYATAQAASSQVHQSSADILNKPMLEDWVQYEFELKAKDQQIAELTARLAAEEKACDELRNTLRVRERQSHEVSGGYQKQLEKLYQKNGRLEHEVRRLTEELEKQKKLGKRLQDEISRNPVVDTEHQLKEARQNARNFELQFLEKKRRVEELEKYLADERARAAQLPQLNSQLEHLKALVATMKKDARFRQVQEAQKQARDARRDAASNEARLRQQERQLTKLKGALAFRDLKMKELRQQNEVFKKVQEEDLWANSNNIAYLRPRLGSSTGKWPRAATSPGTTQSKTGLAEFSRGHFDDEEF